MAETLLGSSEGDAGQGEPTGQSEAGGQSAPPGTGEETGAQGAAAPSAPAEYAPFDLPEGASVDEQGMEAFKQFAGEQGFTQEQAQAALNYHVAALTSGYEAMSLEIVRRERERESAGWKETAGKDPYITRNIGHAEKLVKKFGANEEFGALLDSGMGNNPAFIRFCIDVGRAMGEAPFVFGPNFRPQEKTSNPMLGLRNAFNEKMK
jgi:hypothetical protein